MSQIGTKGNIKAQVAAETFSEVMTRMKNILRLLEFKYESRESEGYKHYKAEIMNQFYPMLEELFGKLKDMKVLEICDCGDSVHKRNGYRHCGWCNGSGYRNNPEFNEFLFQFENKK